MSFTKTLLAGAALCALCTVPALAAPPSIHMGGIDNAMTMKIGHTKSDMKQAGRPSFTETVTFTGTLSAASDLKVPVLLWAETWYSSASCTQPAHQVLTVPKTTAFAKIAHGTSSGTISGCGSTIFNFFGPVYTLTDKHARSDSFPGSLSAKNFVGYNLLLNANTDLTITKN